MIKLFRKIRQNLLMENKTGEPALPAGRYLKYAIGEIVLVVIGIMIALSINNWNQQNQKRDLELINLTAIKKNLTADLELEIKPGIIYYANSKKAEKYILNNHQNSQGLSNDSLTSYYKIWLRRDWRFVFNSAAFDNLKSIGIDIISNDSLRTSVSSIYNHLYPNIIQDNVSSINYFEQQILPKLNDSTSQFNVAFSNNELEFLNNNKQLKNGFIYMTKLRDYLSDNILPETQTMVEDVIDAINKELEQ